MGPKRGILSKSDNEAPASVSQDVMDLVLYKVVTLRSLVAHIGQLQAEYNVTRSSGQVDPSGRFKPPNVIDLKVPSQYRPF